MRSNGWLELQLGEFVTLQRGFDLPAQNRKPGKVPVVSSSGISDHHADIAVRGPGVVTGRYGTIGQVFYVRDDFWPLNTTLWVKDFQGNDPLFAYYLLQTVDFHSCSDKSSVPGVNRNDLHCIQVLVPPVLEQEAIARLLAVLDEKIELNRRMNLTLEALARAMFKSWFVDFDPVVAKAAGKKPVGMSAKTAALFPDRFQDSALGPIPKGWTPSSVAAIARYVNGRNFTKNATGTGRMVIRIAELNSGPGGSTVSNDVMADRDYVALPDDILFAWSGSLDVYRWHGDEALVNQHIFNVVTDSLPKWFVYYHLREVMPFFQGIAADKATTMGHIKREHLLQAELAMPPHALIIAADRIIRPLYDRVHRQERQSRLLAAFRDALLPRLMSGELRVKQAEKLLSQAV